MGKQIDVREAVAVITEAAKLPAYRKFTKTGLARAIINCAISGHPAAIMPFEIKVPFEPKEQEYFSRADLERCAELKKELAALVSGKVPGSMPLDGVRMRAKWRWRRRLAGRFDISP